MCNEEDEYMWKELRYTNNVPEEGALEAKGGLSALTAWKSCEENLQVNINNQFFFCIHLVLWVSGLEKILVVKVCI
jgi:hypothetical protein